MVQGSGFRVQGLGFRVLSLEITGGECDCFSASAHPRVVEPEISLQFVLVVCQSDDGRHQLLVDDAGDQIIDVDDRRPLRAQQHTSIYTWFTTLLFFWP